MSRPLAALIWKKGVEMHNVHNRSLQRHTVVGAHVVQWHKHDIASNMAETQRTWNNLQWCRPLRAPPHRDRGHAVMLEFAELELGPGTRASETEALSCVFVLPVSLKPIATDATHTGIDIVTPHELIPGRVSD